LIGSFRNGSLLIFGTVCRNGELEANMNEETVVEALPAVPGSAAPIDDDAAADALLEDLLVEEVSIDGMCGVY
jgi:mycofactocin precursor